jgi:hypothetical protein
LKKTAFMMFIILIALLMACSANSEFSLSEI